FSSDETQIKMLFQMQENVGIIILTFNALQKWHVIYLKLAMPKRLWGHSENAVNINIWVAIGTYLIVAYVKHILKSNLSIHEIMQILGVSAFDKTPVKELLTEFQVNQNVKEQLDLFCINF
ncbi:hypothetical protein EZS27_024243, partial [termite gut metagenome]